MSSESEEDAFSAASDGASDMSASDHDFVEEEESDGVVGVEPVDDVLLDSPAHSPKPGSSGKKRKVNTLGSAQKIKAAKSKVTTSATIKKNRMVIDSDDDDDDFEEDVKKKNKKESSLSTEMSPKTSPKTSPKAAKSEAKASESEPKKATSTTSSHSSSLMEAPASKKLTVGASSSKKSSNTSAFSPPKQIGTSSSTISAHPAPPPVAVVVDITRGPPVQTESKARELILKYIKQQNRPYSAVQIYDNLHHRIVKGTVERVLEKAAEKAESGIRVKEYGKSKIYYPDQSKMEMATPNMLAALDRDISDLQSQVKQAHQEENEHKRELNKIRSEPNDDEIDALLADKEAKVKALQERLSAFSSSPVDENALENTIIKYNFYRSKWVERKRGVMDVVDSIAEGMDKKVGKVCEDIGIETDEDYKMVLPPKIDNSKRTPLGNANR